jgi:thymidine phosphorylase
MEVLARVDLAPEALHEIVRSEHGCLVWGGTARLAPADDMLIAVERPLGIDSPGLMVASILAKKLAAGSTHLLIDIPAGPGAKVQHMRQAIQLRKLFEYVGDRLDLQLEVVITDGRQPIGRGIGPVLEARDVMQILHNTGVAPADLREKALRLAGRIIEFDADVRGGDGYRIAREILQSGRALEKMNRIIDAQGRRQESIEPGRLTLDIAAPADGVVVAIDNLRLARIARHAGAPLDKGAGVDLLKKLGDRVSRGEPLYRIYAEFTHDLEFARRDALSQNGYTIGSEAELPPALAGF